MDLDEDGTVAASAGYGGHFYPIHDDYFSHGRSIIIFVSFPRLEENVAAGYGRYARV